MGLEKWVRDSAMRKVGEEGWAGFGEVGGVEGRKRKKVGEERSAVGEAGRGVARRSWRWNPKGWRLLARWRRSEVVVRKSAILE